MVSKLEGLILSIKLRYNRLDLINKNGLRFKII